VRKSLQGAHLLFWFEKRAHCVCCRHASLGRGLLLVFFKGELPNAPVERVAEASEGMVSDSSGWAASHCGSLTCHGTELHRSSNPDMTISAKHNQDAACTV
jgi:hypothetical protein